MAKQCLIYETLNNIKDLKVSRNNEGLMTLTGVFGVCGVKNNNHRIYEASNYGKMVTEMKSRIKESGGIPGELEHPQTMNITLENVSHKITDINIDENGVATGTIVLLNTPKGKIAQAIVEGGLPLFVSSRATGNVDKGGHVTLDKISTYDLVGTPGFSQARMHLNEGQICESLDDTTFIITNENNSDTQNDMDIEKRLELLETKITELQNENTALKEALNDSKTELYDNIIPGIEEWCKEELAPGIEDWCSTEFASTINEWCTNDLAQGIQNWVIEEYSPNLEKWLVEDYATAVQDWLVEDFSPEIQNWILEEYTPEVNDWVQENFISEESKQNNLSAIDETLKVLESLETPKPSFGPKMVTESVNEPLYIANMPEDARVKWNMASDEIKESISRRAKLYNFVSEESIERFWNNINFDEIKPVNNTYESLNEVEDMKERAIRESLRNFRNRRMM